MKGIFNSMAALALLSVAFTACQKEHTDAPAGKSRPFYVTVNNPFASAVPQSKATFEDGKGMCWEDTDYSRFLMVVGTEKSKGSVSSAKSMTVDADGVATFAFDSAPAEGSTVSFFYGPGTNLEYTFNSAQTQTTLGKLNAENLCLKAVNVNVSESSAAPQMTLVGSLRRFLIYSSTGKYSSEKVESIKMSSSDNVAGLVAYNYLGGSRANPGADYDTVAETETLIWSQSTAVTVTVTDGDSILATDRDGTSGKGIYMSVPAVSLSGYRYIITTDAAEYVLDAEDSKSFENGTVGNVFINLENSSIVRQEKGETVQEVKYVGGLPEQFTLESAGKSDHGISYWYATVDGVTRENRIESAYDGRIFYSTDNVKFECTDGNGAAVTWISCKYRENDTWWDATYEANDTGAERTAVITATYSIPGYVVTPATKSVKVIQPAQ